MTSDEKKHIDTVGLDKFYHEMGKAQLRLALDGKLRGATKLREELSYFMALKATGFAIGPLSLASKTNTKRFGHPTTEMQELIDGYLNSVEMDVSFV